MSEKIDINEFVPGFDYENLTDEQKAACDELIRLISEKYENIDWGHMRTVFKLEEKKYAQPEDFEIWQMLKDKGVTIDKMGWIKSGLGADQIHYPIISATADVRVFQELLDNYKKKLVDLIDGSNKT
tara:strand:- start:52 stop:432 length:381 start_codon:yes stop_codon:yes gene_type:complete